MTDLLMQLRVDLTICGLFVLMILVAAIVDAWKGR